MNFSLKPVFIGWITLLAQLPDVSPSDEETGEQSRKEGRRN